jgi:hypothetical protein
MMISCMLGAKFVGNANREEKKLIFAMFEPVLKTSNVPIT